MAVLRRTWLAAARLASRALAAWMTRWTIASATLLFLIRKSSSRGRTIESTSARTSGLFSRPLVWPWNCGSRTQTERTAVSPSRMSSALISGPFLASSWSLMNFCTAARTASRRPDSCVPPSRVGIVLTNERMSSSVASVQARASFEPQVVLLLLQHERRGGDAGVLAGLVDGVEEVADAAVVAELDARCRPARRRTGSTAPCSGTS